MSLDRFDLKHTIMPLVSIDEFEPKSGTHEEVLVVALYCADQGPAKDLNTFIQRGNYANIDAEVSPNPDEEGRYLLFVEFERNKEFLELLPAFLRDIENLTDKMDWEIKPHFSDKPMPYDAKKMKKYVIVDPLKMVTKEAFQAEQGKMINKEEKAETLLRDSYLKTLTFESGFAMFNDRVAGKLIDVDHEDIIVENHDLSNKAMSLEVPTAEISSLWAMLGESYDISTFGNQVVISKTGTDEVLILEEIMFVHKL